MTLPVGPGPAGDRAAMASFTLRSGASINK